MKRYTIIVAGGKGLRMGHDTPKQFLEVAGRPVLAHTLERIHRFDSNMEIILVLPAEQQAYWQELCCRYNITTPHRIATGGATRFHSVRNGLALVDSDGLVAIHDGVRPLVSAEVIAQCFATAEENWGSIHTLPTTDSLRKLHTDCTSQAVNRAEFVTVQTPHTFRTNEIKHAYEQPYRDNFTDDASVYEAAGYSSTLVEGNRENLKITLPADLLLAEILLKQ